MRRTITAFGLIALAVILMSGTIDFAALFNYESQAIPAYITRDNTTTNPISDADATLGRVLFYDKNLSSDNSTSCASCHQQAHGFSDLAVVSQGANGLTGRHSMRLINSRFSDEGQFFWDERAATLEEQTTQPIRDHGEMGFSGTMGDPDFADLITKLEGIQYYEYLFFEAFGDTQITEERMQMAIAQFVRSIQSFDSRYDEGLALNGGNENGPFSNFTPQENQGKNLFRQPIQFETPPPGQPFTGNRIGGGLGCQTCHTSPEFAIDPNSRNNGVITVANNPGATDFTNTRSPTLRDLFAPDGSLNGPMMHDGSLATIDELLDHYNVIVADPAVNPNLDIRLTGGPPPQPGTPPQPGPGQNLNLTTDERAAIEAFLKTLTGSSVYTDERWSDPFEPDGTLTIVNSSYTPTCDIPTNIQVETPSATSAVLTWDEVPTATKYQVRYRIQGETEWNLSGVLTNTKTLSGLTSQEYYEYRVRALCGGTVWSDYSPLARFYSSACSYPENQIATLLADPTNVEFSWDEVAGVTKYQVRYRGPGEDWIVVGTSGSQTFKRQYGLLENATYEYRVRSLCSDGIFSNFGPIFTFTTGSVSTRLSSHDVEGVKVYPNPALDELNVIYPFPGRGEVTYRIHDLNGKSLETGRLNMETGAGQISLDVSRLQSGYYFISIINHEGSMNTVKFMKM